MKRTANKKATEIINQMIEVYNDDIECYEYAVLSSYGEEWMHLLSESGIIFIRRLNPKTKSVAAVFQLIPTYNGRRLLRSCKEKNARFEVNA